MSEMEKILREVLAEDRNILSRRDDLLAALDKKVFGNLMRDYTPIKKAIKLNIGEIFFVGSSDKDATKVKATKILKASGLQEARINFVIETFANALNEVEKLQSETVAKSKINTIKAAQKILLVKTEKPKKIEEPPQVFDFGSTIHIPDTSASEENISKPPDELKDSISVESPPKITDCMPLPPNHKEKIFTAEGRLNRWAYFTRSLKICGLAFIGAITLDIYVGYLILIAAAFGGFMIGIRRLHDLNKSGWWLLMTFIPYVNVVFGLYLLFARGTFGSNIYGQDPLENEKNILSLKPVEKYLNFVKDFNAVNVQSGYDFKMAFEDFLKKYKIYGFKCTNWEARMNEPALPPQFGETPLKFSIFLAYEFEPKIYAVVPKVKIYTDNHHFARAMGEIFQSNFQPSETYNKIRVIKPAIFKGRWNLEKKGILKLE